MKVYRYDEETRLFMAEFEADLDPLESRLQCKPIYLLPANCTFEKPKLEKGKITFWDGTRWNNIVDNRGKCYYDFDEHCIKKIKDFKDYVVLTDEEIQKINAGMTVRLVNNAYDIYWTTEQKQENVRKVRDGYLSCYVDYYQEKPLLWNELNEDVKGKIAHYRQYLLSYPQSSTTWYEQNPKTFEEFQ